MQNEKKLVVLFPGFGYGPDKPLLYYAAKVARRQGLDCMVVQYSQLFPHEETPQASAAKSYPGAALRRALEQDPAITTYFVEGGNHSLDTPEDYTIGLEALKDIVRKYEEAMR